MTDTTSLAKPAKVSSQQYDFAEAMYARFVAKNMGLGTEKRKMLLYPALFLAIGTGLGAAARAGLPPAWATVVTGVMVGLIGVWGVAAVCAIHYLAPMAPRANVHWDTADDYEERITSDLSPDVRAVLAEAQDQVLRRAPAADRVHLYVADRVPEHPCTLDTTGCRCGSQRLNAALIPNRSHPIIKVGDRLLDEPAALAYVLAHEINHLRRPWLQLRFLLQLVGVAGWLAMGLLLPLPILGIVAPAVWAMTMALNWANEIAADVAARTTGPDAARRYWTMRRAGLPTRTGTARLTGAAMTVLAPTHPPIRWRAALADRMAHRP